MVLGIRGLKLNVWVGRRFRIGLVRLEELLDVLDCVISSI